MIKIIKVIFFALAASMTTTNIASASPATPVASEVRSIDCHALTRSACEIAREALGRAPYAGEIRPSTVPMACVRVVSYGPVPIVWIDGTKDNYKTAPVIDDTGIVYTERFGLRSEWVVTESCIPLSEITNVRNLTLCTGTEEGYHWSLTDEELRRIKGDGHLTSYVPFLAVNDRNSLSGPLVDALYRARYHRPS